MATKKERRAAYAKLKRKDPEFLSKERERKRKWRATNREKDNVTTRARYRQIQAHPEKRAALLKRQNGYRRKRYREDPEYRKRCNQRSHWSTAERFYRYQNGAKYRGIPFELSPEEGLTLFGQPCFYCKEPSTPTALMGIDRSDNEKGYTIENCVPCCAACNAIKFVYAWDDVRQHLEAVVATSEGRRASPYAKRGAERSLRDLIYDVRRSARVRGLEVALDDDEIEMRLLSNCVYCGALPNPFNGIDREDNQKGYTTENAVPCCQVCNYMKGCLSKEEFLEKARKIVSHHQASWPGLK